MSRNVESHFALNPSISMPRSKMDMSHGCKTTFNVGDVIPFCPPIEVLPGDTFSIDTNKVVRMQTLVAPIMDNIYLDTYWFFVPNRLVWEHWREFMGENTASAWIPPTTYSIPQLTAPASTGWTAGTIADYFGIPTNVAGLSVNAMPFRGYALIMDQWFRDENLTDPLYISVGDATVAGVNTGNYRSDVAKGGLPFKAAKYHDYFTSCLPAPQKGPDVTIPLGLNAPVYTGLPLHSGIAPGETTPTVMNFALTSGQFASSNDLFTPRVHSNSDLKGGYLETGVSTPYTGTDSIKAIYPNNLYADLSSATGQTINALRIAFQIQKLLERDALGGSRYIEILKAHFGVTSPDARLQRAEYLGGNRCPINIHQVLSTAETSDAELAATGAYSLTVDSHSDFTRSFTEHGYIIGLCVARYQHTYQNALDRQWSRKDRYDYFWPVLSNIGNKPVYNSEIFAQGTSADNQVFGYQEAWAEYRYRPSICTSEFRSNVSNSLDAWHLADEYSSLPTLSDTWIREDKSNVDRALMVQSSVSNQLFADFWIKCHATRCMPVYSIPGLIDHN